jgi:histone deacetylase 6
VSQLADGKVVVALEGGYDLTAISQSAAAVVRTLLTGDPPKINFPPIKATGRADVEKAINAQKKHWKCFAEPPPAVEKLTESVSNLILAESPPAANKKPEAPKEPKVEDPKPTKSPEEKESQPK